MLNHVYLLGKEVLVQELLKSVGAISIDSKNLCLKAKGFEVSLDSCGPWLTRVNLVDRVTVSNLLLGINREESLETSVFRLGLEEKLNLSPGLLKGGIAYFSWDRDLKTALNLPSQILLNPENPMHNYYHLITAEALRRGYELYEQPGKCFYFISPLGKEYSTNYHACSCKHFELHKCCTHTAMVNVVNHNRPMLTKHNLLEYINVPFS
jgi:hypothetical protein